MNSVHSETVQSIDSCECPVAAKRVIESLFKDTDFPTAFYSRTVE